MVAEELRRRIIDEGMWNTKRKREKKRIRGEKYKWEILGGGTKNIGAARNFIILISGWEH